MTNMRSPNIDLVQFFPMAYLKTTCIILSLIKMALSGCCLIILSRSLIQRMIQLLKCLSMIEKARVLMRGSFLICTMMVLFCGLALMGVVLMGTIKKQANGNILLKKMAYAIMPYMEYSPDKIAFSGLALTMVYREL